MGEIKQPANQTGLGIFFVEGIVRKSLKMEGEIRVSHLRDAKVDGLTDVRT